MNDEGGSVELSAVGTGILWGLVIMLAGGVIQGLWTFRTPLSPGVEEYAPLVWQTLGAGLAGLLTGRRVSGSGWLNGGIAGLGLAMTAAAIMGVLTDLPDLAAFGRAAVGGTILGALAGIAGVNWGSR